MAVSDLIHGLAAYAVERTLIAPADRIWAENLLAQELGIHEVTPVEAETATLPLHELLEQLCRWAAKQGNIGDTVTAFDLFDTVLMGALTPRPSQVQQEFWALYQKSPALATDWFYTLSQDTNYIRRDRIAKDQKWVTETEYGPIDITINLSKPEKDPRDIAAAKAAPQSGYPKCLLCRENEGYAGHLTHPARQNLRLIPLTINGEDWAMQYSPYVYYNEHCILLNQTHKPMVIDRSVFAKLLDFVGQFPHYFIGSNADLPIVGGSILSHEHFQGGNYQFAMEQAPVVQTIEVPGFSGTCGIVRWPMSVLRIAHREPAALVELADRILTAWRSYSDEAAGIFAHTDGTPHNTITPIARRRGQLYELDLVLRNNLTTEEHPLGVFHPHAELHNIKKENIGLIEVMGLAVLPSRLKAELEELAATLATGGDLRASEATVKHADWVERWRANYPSITVDNAAGILQREVGNTFKTVLEHAGVFKQNQAGQQAFLRFVAAALNA